MLDLKGCSNAKRYLEKSGLTLEQALEKLEEKIGASVQVKEHGKRGNRSETRNDNPISGEKI